jgi:omega-6 fatty acid desaturase (delta-12 desaturase)
MKTNSAYHPKTAQIEKEIKEKLKNWKEMISKYQIPDHRKATIQMLNTFLPYIGLWALMYFSLNWSIWLTIPIGLVNVFFLVRIFIIQHDCGHQSFLRSSRWNNLIGVICSVFSTIPYKYWAKVHNHHHGHTGILEERDIGDINFITVEEYRKRGKWGRFRYRFFRHPLCLFIFAPFVYFTISNRFPNFNLKGWYKIRRTQVLNNVLIVGLYTGLALLLGWKKFLFIQLTLVFLFFIVAFWFFYVQHQHEDGYMRWRKNWDFLIASIRGSTYYKLPRLFQWLTGNIGIHHIHHLSARIPNYHLEKCLKENPVLTKYANVVTFWGSIKLAANKLWDEETKRMITFTEYYRMEKVRFSLQ